MEHRQVSDKTLSFITSALELALQLVVFLALNMAFAVFLISEEQFVLYRTFIIIIPVVVGYLARKYIDEFYTFMSAHIILIIVSLFIGTNDAEKTINIISTVICVAYSIRLKNMAVQTRMATASSTMLDAEAEKEAALRSMAEGEKIPLYCAVVMIIGYFAASSHNNVTVMEFEILLCVIFVVLEIVYGNALNLYQVFRINRDKSNFPATQMKKVTGFVTVISSGMVMLAMILFYNGKYGNIVVLVKNILYTGFKFVARLFLAFLGAFGKEGDENIVEETTMAPTIEETETYVATNEDFSQFMEALAEAFALILIIACIIGIIYVLRQFIKNFNHAKKFGTDIIENVKPEEEVKKADKVVIVNQRKETRTEKNVRKMYKKLVLRGNKGKAPDSSHTPKRLTADNITQDEKLADEITYIYEKARYSDRAVTKEEVEKMKQL